MDSFGAGAQYFNGTDTAPSRPKVAEILHVLFAKKTPAQICLPRLPHTLWECLESERLCGSELAGSTLICLPENVWSLDVPWFFFRCGRDWGAPVYSGG